MTRERLRNRRLPEVLEFQAMGMRLTGSVSRYPDGRPGEIFIDNHNAGSGWRSRSVSPCNTVPTPTRPAGAVPRQRRPAAQPARRAARPYRGGFGMIDVPAMRNCARYCWSATHNNTWTTALGGALRQRARWCSRLFVEQR
jgi:hypothetical protein